jgi:SAM-dependent methyltransferase
METRKSTLSACIIFAIVSAVTAAAQSVPAARKPDVAYVPTTSEAVKAMLKLADVTSSDTVFDLGCGDGRIVIAAAKLRGARGVGIDIDPVRVSESRASAKKAGVERRVRFEENDVFEADIHEATVVTLFLLPELNVKLLPKLLRDLKPGTRIVSNTFDMGDWRPAREATVGDPDEAGHPFSHRLFLWIVPPRTTN